MAEPENPRTPQAGGGAAAGVGERVTAPAAGPPEDVLELPQLDRVAVIVNGNARSVNREVIELLDRTLHGGDLFVSRTLADGEQIARTVVERGYGTVLTGGGDGTFTVVVTQVLAAARALGRPVPRFGLLKLGTGNALAWVVGAGDRPHAAGLTSDLRRSQGDAGTRPLRLVEVEGKHTPFCGFGIDAVVLQDYQAVKGRLLKTPLRSVAPGPLSYFVAATTRSIPSFVVRPVPHLRVRNLGAEAVRIGAHGSVSGAPVRRGEVLYEGPARIASLSTIPYYGFGLRAFPYAEEREGRMQLRISTISSAGFVRHFRAIWRGEYDDPRVMFDYLVEHVELTFDPPTPFQIGGDAVGERRRVEVRLSPEPIHIVDHFAPPRGA